MAHEILTFKSTFHYQIHKISRPVMIEDGHDPHGGIFFPHFALLSSP
jgi:hypothetical protein